MSCQIGIVMADAYPLGQVALEHIVMKEQDMQSLGKATSIEQVIERCQSLKPKLLLLVPNLVDYDPVESVLRIQTACPRLKVLMLSASTEHKFVQAALNLGVSGYVLQSEPIQTIVQAIRIVAQGGQWISPSLLWSQQRANQPCQQARSLSKRQQNVLGLMIAGKTDKQIGEMLNVHERTVRHYLRQLYNNLGVDTRVEAAVRAYRLGLV